MKVLHHFTELHSDECTSVEYSKYNPSLILTSGEDQVLNLLDLKSAEKEDEFIEASYTSEQPLANWGFIGNTGLAYVITSINTIEILDLETMLVVKNWSKFEHEINYAIQAQYINDKMLFFMGNNKGETYIYQFEKDNNDFQLLDMILTNEEDSSDMQEADNVIVRNAFWIDDENVVVSFDTGHILNYKYHTQEENKAQLEFKEDIKFDNSAEKDISVDEDSAPDIEETIQESSNKRKRKFKPF